MNQIKKHSFEAVSLLTAANGMLEATIIPAIDQPDWIVPSALILESVDHSESDENKDADHKEYYSWQQQSVPVFYLIPKDQSPNSVVILEGNSIDYRLALKIKGQLRQIEVSISEVQDSKLPQEYSSELSVESVSEDSISSYLYQTIMIEDTVYMVPDLDKIAHQLVNINS